MIEKILKTIPIFFILVLLVTIFMFSEQDGAASSETGNGVLSWAIGIFNSDITTAERSDFIKEYGFLFRKMAHAGIYFLMGVLAVIALDAHNKKWYYAPLFGVAAAAFDEIHQMFIPGRAGVFTDVLIDMSGFIVGCLMLRLLYKIFSQKA